MRDWTQSCDASVAARSSGQSQAFEEKRGGGRGGEKRLEGGGGGGRIDSTSMVQKGCQRERKDIPSACDSRDLARPTHDILPRHRHAQPHQRPPPKDLTSPPFHLPQSLPIRSPHGDHHE